MEKCHGALILGLVQGRSRIGSNKTETKKGIPLPDSPSPTPWNQLEAGIAYAMGLPMMIVKEPGISGGVFDIGAAGDQFVHALEVTNSRTWRSDELKSSLDEWRDEVVQHARATRPKSKSTHARKADGRGRKSANSRRM
jgi:hypothetical protein